jgi:hypothetical protein
VRGATTQRGHRWLVVPEQVDKAAAIAFARVFIGVFWLFEVTVGHNWKLGGFGSSTNPGWVGPGAGDAVRENIATAVDDGTWSWAAWVFQNMIEPNAGAFSYLVIVLQVALGLFFVFGFMVRPMTLLALAFDLSIYFLGNSRIPPFFTASHLFLLATNAGMYYGADGWLSVRLRAAGGRGGRGLLWLMHLPLLARRNVQAVLLGGSAFLAMYFFLQMLMRPTLRMNMVSMELAFIFGAVAVGLYAAHRASDKLAVVVALLRIFIGFKLLHEIWVRVEPGVNALPGWASSDSQSAVFETIVDNHWGLFSWLVDSAVLPVMGLWVVVFGVIQAAVGVALLLGVRTRLAAAVGLFYLGGLMVLGFTRYAPFVFGLLVVVLALDGGRALGVDSRVASVRAPRYGLPIPKSAVLALVVVAAVNFVAAAVAVVSTGGIAPDGYTESMGQMVTGMVAIFSGMFAFIGWLQLESGGAEESEPAAEHKGWVRELTSV